MIIKMRMNDKLIEILSKRNKEIQDFSGNGDFVDIICVGFLTPIFNDDLASKFFLNKVEYFERLKEDKDYLQIVQDLHHHIHLIGESINKPNYIKDLGEMEIFKGKIYNSPFPKNFREEITVEELIKLIFNFNNYGLLGDGSFNTIFHDDFSGLKYKVLTIINQYDYVLAACRDIINSLKISGKERERLKEIWLNAHRIRTELNHQLVIIPKQINFQAYDELNAIYQKFIVDFTFDKHVYNDRKFWPSLKKKIQIVMDDLNLSLANEQAEPFLESSKTMSVKKRIKIKTPKGAKWEDINMQFVDSFTVRITGKKTERTKATHKDLGFYDDRTADMRGDEQWSFLYDLAKAGGEIAWGDKAATDNRKKTKQLLSKGLKEIFGIKDDPFFPYKIIKGYKTKFKLFWGEKESNDFEHGEQVETGSRDLGFEEHYKSMTPSVLEKNGEFSIIKK